MKAGQCGRDEIRQTRSLPHPLTGQRLAERFYAELLATLEYGIGEIAGGMEVTGWDWLSRPEPSRPRP